VVNLSTVGTSQVMAPDGTTLDGLPAGEPGHMLTEVPLRTGVTPAVIAGPWIQALIGWGSAAALVMLGIAVALVARRDTTKTPAPSGTGVTRS
jgi:apolipoprotein N-acyltransferase